MIRCQGLGKRYGGRWLFRRLDIEARPGDCLVVTGVNGSGKSTLLRLLAGVLPPTEGRVDRGADPRRTVGYAALDQAVYPMLTVAEHLEIAARLRGVAPRVEELLREAGLEDAAHVAGGRLSTGMRARLKFALAVQAEPPALLLDEPGAGLDANGQGILERLIRTRIDRAAIVIATNDPQERRFATHELELG
jgi:ABC-type multidrug transport system ATPase subunit